MLERELTSTTKPSSHQIIRSRSSFRISFERYSRSRCHWLSNIHLDLTHPIRSYPNRFVSNQAAYSKIQNFFRTFIKNSISRMPKKGSRRKKTRTHVNPADSANDPTASKTPKSFVVKAGVVGGSVAGLVRDVRKVLEPNTGTRIRVRSILEFFGIFFWRGS